MKMMLGNQTPEQIEKRLRISLSNEHKEELRSTWQQKAENITEGKWHCFDIPFMFVCGDIETAKKVERHFYVIRFEQSGNVSDFLGEVIECAV